MVGDTSLFWGTRLFLSKNRRNRSARGALPASLYLDLLPLSQLTAADTTAVSCKPQLRLRPG